MRRDYFTCIFLACICAALFFVCFEPLYFTYGAIVVREFSLFERIMSFIYAIVVLLLIPAYSAYRKKLWMTWGLAFYGLFVLIPVWMLPGLQAKVTGEDASLISVLINFVLRSIYSMSRAPFAALSQLIGDKRASGLPNLILPLSLGIYALWQIIRYYRDAYIAEQVDPKSIIDTTASENKIHREGHTPKQEAPKPEALGTVISAPVAPGQPKAGVPAAPVHAAPAHAAPVAPAPTAGRVPTTRAVPSPTRVAPVAPAPGRVAPSGNAVRPPVSGSESSETIKMPPVPAKPQLGEGNNPYDSNGAIRL